MGEGHAYSTYELPILKLVKYLAVCIILGFILGWLLRYTSADYYLSLWLWQTFILTYWYVTLPAIALMFIVAYLFRQRKPKVTKW